MSEQTHFVPNPRQPGLSLFLNPPGLFLVVFGGTNFTPLQVVKQLQVDQHDYALSEQAILFFLFYIGKLSIDLSKVSQIGCISSTVVLQFIPQKRPDQCSPLERFLMRGTRCHTPPFWMRILHGKLRAKKNMKLCVFGRKSP